MPSKEQIADAVAEYILNIPYKSQASIPVSDVAQVVKGMLDAQVTASDIMNARDQLEQRGVTLANNKHEHLPYVEPTGRGVMNKTDKTPNLELAKALQQKREQRKKTEQ